VALAVFAFIPGVASEERIRVVDSLGNVISLSQPAKRLVALSPHLVENIFSAGAGTKLVGTVGYSDFPAAAQSLPEVGDFGTFSVERIAQLQPDLILIWGSGNGQAAWERLQTLGIPVYVDEIRSLQDIPTSLRNIGALAGTQQSAERAARTFEHDVEALRLEYSRKSEVSVFYQIWHEPLQTLNGDHLMNQVLEICGGNNIFADTAGLAPVINIESVLVADPSAIIASGANASRPDWLDQWLNYPTLTAVQTDQIYYIDPDLIQRPTLRLATGAKLLCQQLDTARAHLAD
jgi:iron complex transport system substrate-binding protein